MNRQIVIKRLDYQALRIVEAFGYPQAAWLSSLRRLGQPTVHFFRSDLESARQFIFFREII
jgi:hypothetical protein